MYGGNMRRLLLLVSLAFVGSLFLAPSAVAQEEEMEPPQEEATESLQEEIMEESMEPQPEPPFAEEKQMEKAKMEGTAPLPPSGGPPIGLGAVALPAAALLIGAGVLAYTVLRRR